MRSLFLVLFVCVFFNSCKKENLLEAEFSSDSFGDYRKKLTIKNDRTFEVKVYNKVFDDPIKKDSLSGKVKIENDTLYFDSKNKFFWAEKAILKNGYIEFFQDEQVYKLEIIKSKLKQSQTIDYSLFPNYAVYPFINNNTELRYYELTTKYLVLIDKLIRYEIGTNSELRNYENYIFQVTAFLNSKNEILVDVDLFCNDRFYINSFKFNQIKINDGENCNVWIELNLSKNEILETHISGF